MTEQGPHKPEKQSIKAQVSEGFEEAKEFARTLDFDDVKSGQWFVKLLQKVVHAYDRNVRTEYFRRKYPGLPPDALADILISVTTRYATLAGGVAGAAATSAQVTTLGTAGMTAPVFVGAIGAEMIYLAKIQLRLVLDLSVVYDLQLDPDDPEDVLMVFAYAMGVAPAEMGGMLVREAARGGTTTLVKKYFSKNVLKAIQDFARKLGFRVLQRTILKYTVPVVSAAVGGGYNYVTTRTIGGIAKAHFKNRRKFTVELQPLLSRQYTYDLAFPAAALHLANLDGMPSPEQRELYRAMLSRMSFEEHTPAEFQRLIDDEANLLEAVAGMKDGEHRRRLIDVLVLMGVCDGELGEKESWFLTKVAGRLDVSLDLDGVERKAQGYRKAVKQSLAEKVAGNVRGTATAAGDRAKSTLGKVFKRRSS